MTDRQLSSLLYRDHLGMKHSRKQRLQEEIEVARAVEAGQRAQADLRAAIADVDVDANAGDVAADPFRAALMSHMLQAGSKSSLAASVMLAPLRPGYSRCPRRRASCFLVLLRCWTRGRRRCVRPA